MSFVICEIVCSPVDESTVHEPVSNSLVDRAVAARRSGLYNYLQYKIYLFLLATPPNIFLSLKKGGINYYTSQCEIWRDILQAEAK